MIRIKSIGEPFTTPRLAAKGASILARAEAMGLFAEREPVVRLDADTFGHLAARLSQHGIGSALMPILTTVSDNFDDYLDRFTDALEASPIPAFEWKQLTRVLGVDLLERLLGVSAVSIARYARAARQTPDDVAARLHWLALVVGDLAGAYNDIGIRQWFTRKRAQLDGRAPAQILGTTWKPDDPRAQRVRDLAHALVGSPAT
jgi:hypothetical protein